VTIPKVLVSSWFNYPGSAWIDFDYW